MKTTIFFSGVSLALLTSALILPAQPGQTPIVKNPPVNVEVMFSNRGVAFQMLVNKKW
jgi:hypothetical protein